jgi:hypothetical protein
VKKVDSTTVPILITAWLQNGVALDPRYGIALDGLLASQLREDPIPLKQEIDNSNSKLGLSASQPKEFQLPLLKCGENEDWHWLATNGQSVDHLGRPFANKIKNENKTKSNKDSRKANPIIKIMAPAMQWHAVGNLLEIKTLLENIKSIGAKRGEGEGVVIGWEFNLVSKADNFIFGHTHPDGSLGRPVPIECAKALGISTKTTGYAGLRPPLFHPSQQRLLVIPSKKISL